MKAKELAKILLENPDFDVVFSCVEGEYVGYIKTAYLRRFNVTGFYDIDYSDKQIDLDIKETDD